jgi:proton-translocating NADH-quinone oxidoreductase chain N
MRSDDVLSLFILMPLACLLVLNLPFWEWLRKQAVPAALLVCLVQVGLVLLASAGFWTNPAPLDSYFGFALKADGLSQVLLLSIGIVLFAALFVGQGMLGGAKHRADFAALLLLAMIGMNGTVLMADIFSLYVFIEITSVSSFILIASRRDKHGLEGAFKYIVLSMVATVMMLTSIALLLLVAGSTSFGAIHAALSASSGSGVAKAAMGAFVCGLFVKGGLVPFHGWLPAAYTSAPAPVSVFLAGIATKASGIYALLRLTTAVFTPSEPLNHVLLLVGAVSIVVGALSALGQQDMKWLLAYSSISQVGYIVLGLGCGTKLGFLGAVLHLFNHAVFKSLLFVNSAAVEDRLGTTDMNRMGGLGARMPITGATSVVGLLSTAGIPPLAGFWSKLLIIVALWQAGLYSYAWIAVLFSVVTLAYLLVMQRKVFFGKVPDELANVQEAGFGLVFPAVVLAVITVVVGLLFPFVLGAFLSSGRGPL